MAIELDGDFQNVGDVERPIWTDPCGGPDLVGRFDIELGLDRPVLDDGIGTCLPDDSYFKNDFDGLEYPTLFYDDYDDIDELIAGCCGGSSSSSESSSESSSDSDSDSSSESESEFSSISVHA